MLSPGNDLRYTDFCAAEVVEAQIRHSFGASIMIVIGIILSIAGLGALCALLFTFATLAFPLFIAINVGMWFGAHGMGTLEAILLGVPAGVATLDIGQLVFITSRWAWLRLLVGLVFAVPAGIAGYSATLGLTGLFLPSEPWKIGFGVVGAIAIGTSALARLVPLDLSAPARQPARQWAASAASPHRQ